LPQVVGKILPELIPFKGQIHRGLQKAKLVAAVVAQPFKQTAVNLFML